jgi:hypothetical protein
MGRRARKGIYGGGFFGYDIDTMINSRKRRVFALMLALVAPLLTARARANIYATDLRMNGAQPLVTNAAFSVINITYILNEPADLGVTINIASGTNVVRALPASPGANGALLGTNLVPWDGNDSNGFPVPTGDYVVSVTPASSGHTNWAQISRDTNAGNYVFAPRGLAVDNNSNSVFYGRVFVGNAATWTNYATVPGGNDTILMLNADGSFSADGPDGTGGYAGIEDYGIYGAPQKMRVGDDDRLYMMDLNNVPPQLVSFDLRLAGYQIVLGLNNYINNPFWDNYPYPLSTGVGWFSMDVTGAGTTNGLIWLGEWDAGGAGVWNWHLTNGVADPDDSTGNWAIEVGGSLGVAASGGLMVDTNLDLFVGQYLTDLGDTNAGCMEFTNWNSGRAFNGNPETNGTAWSAGGNDNTFLGVYDTTIDSRQRPRYVACALSNGLATAGVRILDARGGTNVVANLDAANQYFVTAWDNVGNLYAASGTSHLLRVYSPPDGPNQATTLGAIRIESAITGIRLNGTNLTITFVGSKSDNVGQITLQSCASVNGAYANVPGAVPTQTSPGFFTVTTPAPATTQFYRISHTAAQ